MGCSTAAPIAMWESAVEQNRGDGRPGQGVARNGNCPNANAHNRATNAEMQTYTNTEIQKYRDIQIQRYTNTQIHEY